MDDFKSRYRSGGRSQIGLRILSPLVAAVRKAAAAETQMGAFVGPSKIAEHAIFNYLEEHHPELAVDVIIDVEGK